MSTVRDCGLVRSKELQAVEGRSKFTGADSLVRLLPGAVEEPATQRMPPSTGATASRAARRAAFINRSATMAMRRPQAHGRSPISPNHLSPRAAPPSAERLTLPTSSGMRSGDRRLKAGPAGRESADGCIASSAGQSSRRVRLLRLLQPLFSHGRESRFVARGVVGVMSPVRAAGSTADAAVRSLPRRPRRCGRADGRPESERCPRCGRYGCATDASFRGLDTRHERSPREDAEA